MCERRSIVCITADPGLRRTLRRTLMSLSDQVTIVDSLSEVDALPTSTPELLVIDCGGKALGQLAGELQQLGWSSRVIALGDFAAQEEALSILDLCHCDNLIARNEATGNEAELLATAMKLLCGQDLFGLDKYLAWGAQVREHEVHTYDDKRLAIESAAAFAREIGCRRQLVGRIEIVADELLMNALYDAPASQSGDRRPYVERARPGGGPVSDRSARLRYASDGRHFGLSVSDAFGALRRETILQHLHRAISLAGTPVSDATRGAGLGLYFILNSVSRFVVNVQAGVTTEVICLFDLRTSSRDVGYLTHSFNLFFAQPPGPPLSAA